MMDERIAAPLAQALVDKGYDALTSVQEAVLKDEAAGRDVLVSAQTGSGKTVAFGLAIAPEVLGGIDTLMPAERPLALVVAPTRELALQVRREFEWLYGPAGAMLASCVGGMDYRNERRALERGAHVVVGTPGRLRDHIERGSLDLSGIRAVVLDEADEMLDMGFQEDLEFILSAAPEGRRTLMFSATVPKEIENLAGQYQTNALRIVAAGESKQHGDISYRGYSVAVRDREHAIFNLLRYHEARMALVFCKTRANVNHLLARMGNRGFQAVALSGELSQTERMHALQALRDGRARVCIATDVAARGIDLPGLELVIHADLPSNPDTLLHRSGRTGRAGSKGISALIVTPAEFRKASRILQAAKVTAEWGSPPSADEVQARDDARLLEHPALAETPGDEAALATAILERFGPERAAAAFVRLWREGRSAPEVLSDALPPPSAAASAPRSREAFGDAVWFVLNVGHTGRAEARWLLPKVCDAGGVTKDAIGAIRVQQDETYIQIATASAARFAEGMELEPGLTITRIAGEPAAASRPPSARPAAPRRAAPRDAAPRDGEERPAYRPKPPRIVEEGDSAAAPVAAAPEAPARKPYAPRDAAERKPYAPREGAERKPYAPREGAERKPYAPREGAERKPYAPREGADRKPYAPREGADRKPYAPRDGAERKPYASREGAERKPYAPREAADRKPYAPREGAERKPYAPREGADRKPYAPREGADRKPYAPREGAERKPYAPREGAERKPYAPREGADRKPYAPREGADRKPYAPRPAAEGAPAKKPRWSPEDRASTGRAPRAEGFKSHSDRTERPASDRGERPAWPKAGKPVGDARPRGPKPAGTGPAKPRSAGFKSHGGPAGKPGKSTGFKSHAGAGKTPARPAKPPANPSDTSRRFSPPKKPAR